MDTIASNLSMLWMLSLMCRQRNYVGPRAVTDAVEDKNIVALPTSLQLPRTVRWWSGLPSFLASANRNFESRPANVTYDDIFGAMSGLLTQSDFILMAVGDWGIISVEKICELAHWLAKWLPFVYHWWRPMRFYGLFWLFDNAASNDRQFGCCRRWRSLERQPKANVDYLIVI